jgi:hypothetical protein
MGTNSEAKAQAPRFLPFNLTLMAAFSSAMLSLIGAMLGVMIVAFSGTLLGAPSGVVISWLLRKSKVWVVTPLGGAAWGGMIGAVGLAFYRDKDIAAFWGLHGLWIGAASAFGLVVLVYGLGLLAGRLQRASVSES